MDLSYLSNFKDYYVFAGIAFALLVIYFAMGKIITKSRMSNDQKRRTISNLRTAFVFIFFISFLVLWARELYQFIISIAAIGAAISIALKEFFLCFGGSFYRTFSHPFSVGDRIQIGDIRGDVVDVGLLGTQILEVGPKDYTHQFTGRMVSIPNAMFLSKTIFNETDNLHKEKDEYALHVFKVPVENDKDWEKKRDLLLASAEEACNQYLDKARLYFNKIAKRRHVDAPFVEPRINIRIISKSDLELIARVTIPISLKGKIEQQIIKDYLNKIHTQTV